MSDGRWMMSDGRWMSKDVIGCDRMCMEEHGRAWKSKDVTG
jgi:hypothetical protein